MVRRAIFQAPLAVVVAGVSFGMPARAQGPGQQAVLVTGASTGIGRKITELLASRGYLVYAGARKPEDLAALNTIPNVQSIKLDVTDPAEIAAAVATVEKAGRGLYGLVNNAGVAVIEPLIEIDEKDLAFQLDVNVMGPYRVTKAFSRMLIASKGRIVTTGSLSGFLSGPLSGPYSMSKHAVEAFTDALAGEMTRFGVKVSVIEPGNFKSEIGKTLQARMKASGKSYEGSAFQQEMKRFMEGAAIGANDPEPDEVAEAALHALSDPNPRLRYLVVPNQQQAGLTIRKLMSLAAQLNQGHQYSYSRDSLVAMLDQALARAAAPR